MDLQTTHSLAANGDSAATDDIAPAPAGASDIGGAEEVPLVPSYADLFPALPEGPSAAVRSNQQSTWAESSIRSRQLTEVGVPRWRRDLEAPPPGREGRSTLMDC